MSKYFDIGVFLGKYGNGAQIASIAGIAAGFAGGYYYKKRLEQGEVKF